MSEQIDENECHWLRGESMTWSFDEPREIRGFEVRGSAEGLLFSITINDEEQLMQKPVPLEVVTLGHRIIYPAATSLLLVTRGFSGEIRPLFYPSRKPFPTLKPWGLS